MKPWRANDELANGSTLAKNGTTAASMITSLSDGTSSADLVRSDSSEANVWSFDSAILAGPTVDADSAAVVVDTGMAPGTNISNDQTATHVDDDGTDPATLAEPTTDQDAWEVHENGPSPASPLSIPGMLGLSFDNNVANSGNATSMSSGLSGPGSNDSETGPFANARNQNVGVNVDRASNPLTIENVAVAPSPSPANPSSRAATASVVGADTPANGSSELIPTLTVNATNPAAVSFTVSGLAANDKGTVTFTDANGVTDVVAIGSNGIYSTNLSKSGHWHHRLHFVGNQSSGPGYDR